MEQAVFGREVEFFIDEHPIGQYLIDRAQADLEQAHAELVKVDPSDARKILRLQRDALVAYRVRTWLAEAVQDGHNAALLLKQDRDEHGAG